MALFEYGLRRFTEDVDLLVTRESLKTIHEKLVGLGYIEPFTGSKSLRDTELGVRIEFLVTGQYPGDGKPKPVAFPDPALTYRVSNGRRYIELRHLVELKLASGISNPRRAKDLVDVQGLIETLSLALGFAETLDPYVRGKYVEIWTVLRGAPKRFVRILTTDSSKDDELLRMMRADGATVDPDRGTANETHLITTDPELAKRYDMHDESEFMENNE
jgi:hypothetical protein